MNGNRNSNVDSACIISPWSYSSSLPWIDSGSFVTLMLYSSPANALITDACTKFNAIGEACLISKLYHEMIESFASKLAPIVKRYLYSFSDSLPILSKTESTSSWIFCSLIVGSALTMLSYCLAMLKRIERKVNHDEMQFGHYAANRTYLDVAASFKTTTDDLYKSAVRSSGGSPGGFPEKTCPKFTTIHDIMKIVKRL